jgi:hypothetical protein
MCTACWKDKEARLARFDIEAIKEGVNREYLARRRKEKVEFHGKKKRTLRTGYEAGKKKTEDEGAIIHEVGAGLGHAIDLSGSLNLSVASAVEGLKGIIGWEVPVRNVAAASENADVVREIWG